MSRSLIHTAKRIKRLVKMFQEFEAQRIEVKHMPLGRYIKTDFSEFNFSGEERALGLGICTLFISRKLTRFILVPISAKLGFSM